MVVVWTVVLIGGLVIALWASRRAVGHASALAAGSKIPPFVIGITLIAVGTDLPEIANSIIASLSGHGDLNVGDSVGSAATQVTLVLGLLPIMAGRFTVGARRVTSIGAVTIAALLAGILLFQDGSLSRLDGAVLVLAWVTGSFVVWRQLPPGAQPVLTIPTRRKTYHAGATLLGLLGVAIGAGASVRAFIELAEMLEVSEYLLAFFIASVGTSMPELVFDVTALRRGARDLAVGDAFGSSFVDSTLSIGVGPLIAPTAITSSLAIRGSIAAALAVTLVVLLLSRRRVHDLLSAFVLLAIYVGFYVVLI